ncbi:unnamed protein product [Allacma fusca]|uniref:Uncharacterized protein n=1 Tax=Allacma fusca TaxID=39272 RepID=A0A8J2NYZ5_9HEXA|nr:unnamed protein product [Allacma fusca]
MKLSSQILRLTVLLNVCGLGVEAKIYTLQFKQSSLPQNQELWTGTETHSMETNHTGGQFTNYESKEGCDYIGNNYFTISWDAIIWGVYIILVPVYFTYFCSDDISTPYIEIIFGCVIVYLNIQFFEWLSSEIQYQRNKLNVTCHM